LAIVLGLPGLLIIITTRKIAYVGWMLVYLLSLPLWNGVLPAYSFWHFDDFSWGQTRVVAGEEEGGNHGDKEGEFDSTHIVMKRWAEFERERRWRNGNQSRDSYYDHSPKRDENTRYSVVSSAETYPVDSTTMVSSDYTGSRPRHDSNQLLMLPAPLSVTRGMPSASGSMSTSGLSRSSEDAYEPGSSHSRLIPSQSRADDQYGEPELSPSSSNYMSPTAASFESQVSKAAGNKGGALRQSIVPSRHPGETQNPYRLPEPHGVAAMDYDRMSYSAEPEPMSPRSPPPAQTQPAHKSRGVSLVDNGPVSGPDGVRRVARKRPTSQAPPQNRYSRNSGYGLPPGAAPPQPGGGGYNL